LEKTLKRTESDRKPNAATSTMKPCPQHHVYASFKHPQGRLHHCPGQPVPVLDSSPGEEMFPNIQPKPPRRNIPESAPKTRTEDKLQA